MSPDTNVQGAQVIQLLTQLEPAGAQAVAHWLDEKLGTSHDVVTVFMYEKAPNILFPQPSLVAKRRPRNLRDLTRLLTGFLELRRSTGARLIIAHTHYSIAIAAFLWAGKSARVVAVHHWPEAKYPTVCRLAIGIARLIGLFSKEIYVSESVAPHEAVVIPNAVPARGTNLPLGREADLLIVARHATEKSIDTAISALALLPDRRLTLVGGGPLTQQLSRQAQELGVSDRVDFAGRLGNPEVRALLRGCRAFILPSAWEAMPVALLEAVSEGCAIVVSDIDAHDFLLREGAALSFSTGDPKSLAAAVQMLADPTVARELRTGLDRVRDRYSEQAIQQAWVAVIEGS